MFGHARVRVAIALVAVAALGVPLAACGGDDDDAADTSADTSVDTTETTSGEDTGGEAAAASEAMRLGTELCESFDSLDEPGGVDAALALLSDDVVFSDVVLGADLNGKEQVRAYMTSDAFAGIDSNQCGAVIGQGDWAAGTYTLSNSATGAGGSGIAAVHVSDGLVDRQIVHYTQNETDAPSPPEDTISEGIGFDYCHAWDDGADADAVLSYMTDDPTLIVVQPATGADAVRGFVESFDFDQNDCAEVGVGHGDWFAMANEFTNTTTGAAVAGVNILRLEGDRVAAHHVYFDPVA